LGRVGSAIVLICSLGAVDVSAAVPNDDRLSDFSKVKNLVNWHFSLRRDYSPGDILSRSNVEPVLKQLRLIGWTIPNQKSILNRVPRDGNYLVRQLRRKAGRKFMRNVREYPLIYDRLDRLTGLASGRQALQEMIKMPDGHKVMLELTQKTDGKKADPILARVRTGANFDKPTGRIYTVEILLKALKKSYDKSHGPTISSAAK
jgi:hypothetical protein